MNAIYDIDEEQNFQEVLVNVHLFLLRQLVKIHHLLPQSFDENLIVQLIRIGLSVVMQKMGFSRLNLSNAKNVYLSVMIL